MPNSVDREFAGHHSLQIRRIAVQVAIQWIRSAGASLVDHDDIAGVPQRLPAKKRREPGGRSSGSAIQYKDGIGCVIAVQRRQNHDV